MEDGDTIAAAATGMTDSGIGIIRISGRDAAQVGNRMVSSPSGKEILSHAQSHRMYYAFAYDREKNLTIDEVMAVYMKAPRSFTGEDTVEIQCHGGVYVMRRILETALRCGARLAEPGEFTRRAFLNGRMDLSRAEAVMDVIQSQSETALSISMRQLRGDLSREVERMRGELLHEMAYIESALDDPEHFSLDGYPRRLAGKLKALRGEIRRLSDTADRGRILKEGISAVILGKPNAGKSSFLNFLLGEERAIVTDVAGTTRDALQETVRVGEVVLKVTDTAGIRKTKDMVEKIGVERAREYAKDADLILYVADSSVEPDESDREILSLAGDKKIIVLLNKSDLPFVTGEEEILRLFREAVPGGREPLILRTSMREGSGMEEFVRAVEDLFFQGELGSSNEIVITNMRHKEALEEAEESLALVERSIEDGMPEDFYSVDLMNAYARLGRIIGEDVDDDLVDEIFSRFCMGK